MKNIYLFILLVAVLVIGFGTITLSLYKNAMQKIRKERDVDLSIITRAIANDFSNIFTSTEKDLKLLATIYSKSKAPTSEELSDVFKSVFAVNSFTRNIFYLDSDGTMKSIAPQKYKSEIGNNYSFRNYFIKIKESKESFFSAVLKNYQDKKTEEDYDVIVIALPIFRGNKLEGILGADLDLTKIRKLIRTDTETTSKGMSNTGLYWIDFKNAKIVAGSESSTPYNASYEEFLFKVAAKSSDKNEDRFTTYIFKGNKYVVSSNFIMNKKFTFQILGILPLSESVFTIKSLHGQIRGIAIIVGAVILIALFIIIYNEKVLKKLKHRIKDLEIHIDRVQKEEIMTSITESDYYQELQKKIDSLKNK